MRSTGSQLPARFIGGGDEAVSPAPVQRPGFLAADSLRTSGVYLLFFLSGAAGLVFEVLWLKELGILFGNTAHAAATTLAVFFLGLAVGAYIWGTRAPQVRDPLRAYALLEAGVGASALLYFGLLRTYRSIYVPLLSLVGDGPLLPVAKLLLAAGVLFLPALLMGGTFPMLAEALVRRPDRLGQTGSFLYAVNTTGAAVGVFLAGFYLPRMVGFNASYSIAIAAVAIAALGAFGISLLRPPVSSVPSSGSWRSPLQLQALPSGTSLEPWLIAGIAFFSGFATLGMEVLWTRLLAQVLNNSVYAFAAILTTFLAALGLGSLGAHLLARTALSPPRVLSGLCVLAGLAIVIAAPVFVHLTDGLAYLAGGPKWSGYVRAVFTAAAILMLIPAVVMGSVLPYLFRVIQGAGFSPGEALGRLAAANSAGAIAGSLATGFVLLDVLGIWGSMYLMAGVYFALAATAWLRRPGAGLVLVIALLPLGLIASRALPVVRLGPGERLLQVWQGSSGTVTVIEAGDNLILRLNNHYTLGDTRSIDVERMQAHLPLLLHPQPDSVFFLGVGTGISVGSALDHPVRAVAAAELVPDVLTAARAYFAPFTNGVFQDPRVDLRADDGRSYLAGTRNRFDVIIGDLFTPWHAGTGSLYTLEHFRTVRSRLRPGGIFAQWLPLYQLTPTEFFIIARTLTEVFPEVTLWRGDFSPSGPIVALVARAEAAPIAAEVLERNVQLLTSALPRVRASADHMAGLFYAGNMSVLKDRLSAYPPNTDDRPVIEFLAPLREQNASALFTGSRLDQFYAELLTLMPPERDPFLSALPPEELEYVWAGLAFYRYHLYLEAGRPAEAERFLAQFLKRVASP